MASGLFLKTTSTLTETQPALRFLHAWSVPLQNPGGRDRAEGLTGQGGWTGTFLVASSEKHSLGCVSALGLEIPLKVPWLPSRACPVPAAEAGPGSELQLLFALHPADIVTAGEASCQVALQKSCPSSSE